MPARQCAVCAARGAASVAAPSAFTVTVPSTSARLSTNNDAFAGAVGPTPIDQRDARSNTFGAPNDTDVVYAPEGAFALARRVMACSITIGPPWLDATSACRPAGTFPNSRAMNDNTPPAGTVSVRLPMNPGSVTPMSTLVTFTSSTLGL